MKRLILWICISVVISAFFINNSSFAQEELPQTNPDKKMGIKVNGDCLTWMGKWCFDYEEIIWIDKTQSQNVTARSIAQDIIRSATYMVWTVLTIVIIYCGLMYIFASRDGKDVSAYKKWLIYAAIWALLVWWAYAIVRLIQYVAKG